MQCQLNLFDNKKSSGLPRFPKTRYQGSKRKVVEELSSVFNSFEFRSALDLYSGTGTVSLLLRLLKKDTYSNDYMLYNNLVSSLFLSATREKLSSLNYETTLSYLLYEAPIQYHKKISDYFSGIYFFDEENEQIDRFCQNVNLLDDFERSIYIYAVGQALLMKRPYNLFHRANLNMRTRDVKRSFGNAKTWQTSILNHAKKVVSELISFPFDDNVIKWKVFNCNTSDLSELPDLVDLIYLDPPYLNRDGVGADYPNFYHFLDGLCDYKLYDLKNDRYPHKPILSKSTAWSNKDTALQEIQRICDKWRDSIIVFSYRSDGIPTEHEILEVLSQRGRKATLDVEKIYKYALSHSNQTKEQIITSMP
ncbi:MAG: DNA adenine methylase [Rhodospirillales bacterium]|nr:DNA adenine methylase [Rhodospirillales bacterium]